MNKVPGLPPDHESKAKTVRWLTTLHTMRAHEELSEEQVRQMSFDLDSAYNGQPRHNERETGQTSRMRAWSVGMLYCPRCSRARGRCRVCSPPSSQAFHRFVQGK